MVNEVLGAEVLPDQPLMEAGLDSIGAPALLHLLVIPRCVAPDRLTNGCSCWLLAGFWFISSLFSVPSCF